MTKVSNFKITNSSGFDVTVSPQSGTQFTVSDGSTSSPQMVYTTYTVRTTGATPVVLFQITFTADGDLNVINKSGQQAGASFVVSGQLN